MREIIVTAAEEGQRLDRILHRYLKEAPSGFLYRMMRKKNITLNGKKPSGNEKTAAGDVIRLWLSEDTLEKFGSDPEELRQSEESFPETLLDIIYEDDDMLLVNKPAGMLTQKAKPEDVSLNEYIIGYLLRSGQLLPSQLSHFRPSVCNRLDRNTSGIVAAGKTEKGLQELSEMFRLRTAHKYYSCMAAGAVTEEQVLTGFLKKDEVRNCVEVLQEETEGARSAATRLKPVKILTDRDGHVLTLLKILLITGRTHQIRAHLAQSGHPIIGDPKYGDERLNRYFRDHCSVHCQMLHAQTLQFPDGREFTASVPEVFRRVEAICHQEKPEVYEAQSWKN